MILHIDGRDYECGPVEFETVFDNGEGSFVSVETIKVVKLCDHCGNFRLEKEVLHTVDELVEKGWLIPV